MIAWRKQQAALVGAIVLANGMKGSVVLVGASDNPKGAVLIVFSEKGEPFHATPIAEHLDLLSPAQLVEIICAQERHYGSSGLEPLDLA